MLLFYVFHSYIQMYMCINDKANYGYFYLKKAVQRTSEINLKSSSQTNLRLILNQILILVKILSNHLLLHVHVRVYPGLLE